MKWPSKSLSVPLSCTLSLYFIAFLPSVCLLLRFTLKKEHTTSPEFQAACHVSVKDLVKDDASTQIWERTQIWCVIRDATLANDIHTIHWNYTNNNTHTFVHDSDKTCASRFNVSRLTADRVEHSHNLGLSQDMSQDLTISLKDNTVFSAHSVALTRADPVMDELCMTSINKQTAHSKKKKRVNEKEMKSTTLVITGETTVCPSVCPSVHHTTPRRDMKRRDEKLFNQHQTGGEMNRARRRTKKRIKTKRERNQDRGKGIERDMGTNENKLLLTNRSQILPKTRTRKILR